MEMAELLNDGKLLVAWGIGASMGYGFALKTTLKAANERSDELKAELAKTKERITHLEDQRYRDAREDAGKPDMDARLAGLTHKLDR